MTTPPFKQVGDTSGLPHGALIMGGKNPAKEVRRRCTEEIAALRARFGILPGLGVLRVGHDPASVSYAERIKQSFAAAELDVTIVELPANASRALVQAEIARMNVLPEIAGIIVQMPLPGHLPLDTVIDVLDPGKDVDGIHPVNIGRLSLGLEGYVPATAAGAIELLDYYRIDVRGMTALVIGRSGVVGRPLFQLLVARHATVTLAHSHTRNLLDLVRSSDLVATAVGKPGLVPHDCIKQGAVVLDFGATIVDGRMTGDVDYEGALDRAAVITPVPGGTGPMTNAMLLKNTVKAIGSIFKLDQPLVREAQPDR